jgi:hypothetical protein
MARWVDDEHETTDEQSKGVDAYEYPSLATVTTTIAALTATSRNSRQPVDPERTYPLAHGERIRLEGALPGCA